MAAPGSPRVLFSVRALPSAAERLGRNVRTATGHFAAGGILLSSEAARPCPRRLRFDDQGVPSITTNGGLFHLGNNLYYFVMRTFASLLLIAMSALPTPAAAWQDLREDYVQGQVEVIETKGTSAEKRQQAVWRLLDAGRAAIDPLGRIARRRPDLAWSIVHLLEDIRTDAQVVRTFSEFLDQPPNGLKSTGETAGYLIAQLQDMLGKVFRNDEERRSWIKENADYLVYDPALFRFFVDDEARRRKQPHAVTPQRATGHEEVDLAYARLIFALHVGSESIIRPLIGPNVKLIHKQNRVETVPALDIDAFSDPPRNHKAVTIDKRNNRWLVRDGKAYFFFDPKTYLCVEAGLKPLD